MSSRPLFLVFVSRKSQMCCCPDVCVPDVMEMRVQAHAWDASKYGRGLFKHSPHWKKTMIFENCESDKEIDCDHRNPSSTSFCWEFKQTTPKIEKKEATTSACAACWLCTSRKYGMHDQRIQSTPPSFDSSKGSMARRKARNDNNRR